MSPAKSPGGVSGEFRWDSLLCRLFGVDVAPQAKSRALDAGSFAVLAAGYAATGADILPQDPFPRDAPAEARRKLFHERLHYWQLLFCPHIQLQFLYYLDRLQLQAAALGGRPEAFASTAVASGSLDELARLEEHLRSHFALQAFEPCWIKSVNRIKAEEPTAMSFLLMPHRAQGLVLPAYGAILGFAASDDVCVFPFTAPHLFEAAAHLCESLAHGEAPERLTPPVSPEKAIYVGAWEFWRRLHERRYRSQEELALGFLAAVDLALTADPTVEPGGPSEHDLELGSIPYRFGKLAFRAQGMEPLRLGAAGAAGAVHAWQEAYCRACGWPTPDRMIRNMALALTKALAGVNARAMDDTPANRDVLVALFDLDPAADWDVAKLAPMWDLVRLARTRRPPAIGEVCAGAMLNACAFRLENPGEAALPHLHGEALRARFPLPVIMMGGHFYRDDPPSAEAGPYPMEAGDLAHDVVGLIALRPLRNAQRTCGFLEERLACAYVAAGVGCPHKTLTLAEAATRRASGLDDWCHWTLRALYARIAPEETRKAWTARWQRGGGR